METGLGHYLLLMAVVVPVLAACSRLLYAQELPQLRSTATPAADAGAALGFGRPSPRCC